jgi:hypothetical protein
MELHALELIGDEGVLVAYRTFAVCPRCRGWVEFWEGAVGEAVRPPTA